MTRFPADIKTYSERSHCKNCRSRTFHKPYNTTREAFSKKKKKKGQDGIEGMREVIHSPLQEKESIAEEEVEVESREVGVGVKRVRECRRERGSEERSCSGVC